jgi:GNAT superfamily N-acetyltransferase
MERLDLSIRLIGEPDVPVCDAILKAAFGGSETRSVELSRYLEFQPDGWFMALFADQPVGMVGAVDYGAFAYIGLMAVLPEARSQGVGRALMQQVLGWLRQRGVTSVLLDATEYGYPLYRSLGFAEIDQALVFSRVNDSLPTNGLAGGELLPASSLVEVSSIDARIFGANREPVLRVYQRDFPGRCLISRREDGSVSGFLVAQGRRIGPWVADSPEESERLLRSALMLEYENTPLVIAPAANRAAQEILDRFGFECLRQARHMSLGSPVARCRDQIYGQTSFAIG